MADANPAIAGQVAAGMAQFDPGAAAQFAGDLVASNPEMAANIASGMAQLATQGGMADLAGEFMGQMAAANPEMAGMMAAGMTQMMGNQGAAFMADMGDVMGADMAAQRQ